MTPEIQSALDSLNKSVLELQSRQSTMPGNQLTFPLDPISARIIRDTAGGTSASRYVGYSSLFGGGSPFPAGWSCVRVAEGHYLITHNLGLEADSYIVLTSSNEGGITIGVPNRGPNSFDVIVSTSSPAAAANSDFMFELIIP